MLSRHYQDSAVSFQRKIPLGEVGEYPSLRGVVVYAYGGSAEECIKKARATFGLTESEWEVVSYEAPSV